MKTRKIISISGICVFLIVLIIIIYTQKSITAETIIISKTDVYQYVEDTAIAKCKGAQTVYTEGMGKIISVNFNIGDKVKKGDILLSLDKTDLEFQLKDAEAKVKNAKAQLESTDTKNYANKILEAEATVEQCEVSMDAAYRNFETSKSLYEAGAISKDDLNKSEDTYKTASALLKSAKAQLNEIKNGAPSYLKSSYISQLEQALIYRSSILKSLEKQEVRSPIDGIILEKLVDDNSIVSKGTAAFIVGDVKNIELEANILSDDSYKVKVGNEVEISGDSIANTVLKGKIIKIAPQAKIITSALGVNQSRVPVTIEILNNSSILKPGYNVDIKIITSYKKNVIAVPDSVVFNYNGNSCVFVLQNGKAVIRQVEKGLEGDKLIEITKGLKEGDIIIKPDNNIKEGAKIKTKQSKN